MPSEPIGNRKIGIGLETRGYQPNNDGGYIVAEGSRMPDGRAWELREGTPSLFDGPLPEPPQWCIELCCAPKDNFERASSPHSTGRREEAYATKALEAQALKLTSAPPGNRNNATNGSAYSMGRLVARSWIEVETVEARLFDACRYNGLVNEDGETKVRATLRSGIKAGMGNPHPDLRERPNSPHLSSGPRQTNARAFDDPDWSLLDTQRGRLPDFPLEVLSPNLQEVIRRTSKGAGVTHAHVAVPLLGITSGLIGYSRRLKATASWFQPATCWTALVGYSGTGKTPGHTVTRRAAKEVEQSRKKNDEKRKRDHETKKLAAKAARDNWEKKVKEATEAGVPTPEMPEAAVDPGKYVPIRLIVNDGTIERLAELLQARPHGIVLVRDELAALFMNMSRYSGGQDDEFWLESWNGEPHTVERMGRMLSVDHLPIGVVGGMQPDKLVASFEGDHDGKYARVPFAWPDEPGWLGLNNDATEIDTDIYNIISRILTLAEFTQEGRLVSRSIGLDPEAARGVAQFAQFAYQEKSAFEGRAEGKRVSYGHPPPCSQRAPR